MPRAQKGYALLILLLVLVVGATAVFVSARDPGGAAASRERIMVAERLQTAAETVTAYAAFDDSAFDDSEAVPVPGALPCPDYDEPDDEQAGKSTSSACDADDESVYWQRFPWREVGTSRDLAGLWYAIDGAFFRDDATEEVLNLETATGSLTIDGRGAYAAVVIDPKSVAGAPAAVLAAENRDGDADFVNCTDHADCGDRVHGIRSERIFELVRRRVVAAVRQGLKEFSEKHDGHYPWAAKLGDPDRKCDAEGERRVGALPFAASPATASPECDSHLGRHPDPNDPTADDHEPTPAWVQDNNWDEILPLYYAVGCDHLLNPSVCSASAPKQLTLSGESGREVVFGDAGPPIESAAKGAMQDRSGSPPHDVLEYLDSPENTNEDGEFDDPNNGEGENDRMYAIPAP